MTDRSNFNRSQPTTPPRRQQQQSTPSPPNPPPTPPPTPPPHNNQRDYDPEGVGRNLYDSLKLKLFGLGFGATWAEVKHCYRSLSKIYHPDKHKCEDTGMTNEEALSFLN